jgi:hypothetical protein
MAIARGEDVGGRDLWVLRPGAFHAMAVERERANQALVVAQALLDGDVDTEVT